LSTKNAIGLLALLAAAAACSSGDDVTGKPGTIQPPGHDGEDDGRIFDPPNTPPVKEARPPVGGVVVPPKKTAGPWPVADVVHYGRDQGLPDRVLGVGVDDAQNVYVIDDRAVYAARAGVGEFVRTDEGGQLDTGHTPYSVCGGGPGRVYVGYLTYEAAPEELSEEEKLLGDLDRFVLQPDGTLALEFHHRLQNSKAKWMDHTRLILDCARVVGGPNHGDLFVASNHGVTIIRGNDYADHRHVVWRDENGSQAIGYNWAINTDVHGNVLWAGHWKIGALPPPAPGLTGEDLEIWLDGDETPYLINTHPSHWSSEEEPDDMHAIAGDTVAGVVYVGSWGRGLARMTMSPRRWEDVPGTPDTHINSLELDPTDGRLWVGTRSAGLWRWNPATEQWQKHPLVPASTIHEIYLDTTVEPRAVYVATNEGLYVLRGD